MYFGCPIDNGLEHEITMGWKNKLKKNLDCSRN